MVKAPRSFQIPLRGILQRRALWPLALVGVAAALLATLSSSQPPASAAETIAVDPFIWQLNRDYPGANQNDTALPTSRVLVKTHDATNWQGEFDDHPMGVTGPAALKTLVDSYAAQGIEVVAWFVPKGTDVEGQLALAKQVLDTPGIKGLYADVEPYAGFCLPNCAFLAENFWKRLRQERPDAKLGVIYDPREWWIEEEAAPQWLAHADVALPMCYWESYYNQGPWGDPAGCIIQGYYGMLEMTDNEDMLYEPAFQGDASPARFTQALDAALDVGSKRVTAWRRGTMSQGIWDAIASYSGTIDRPCWVEMPDGCLIAEINEPAVYLIEGGAKFHIPNQQAFHSMGFTYDMVDPAPNGFMDTVPNIPRDDTLLMEHQGFDIFVVYGGARFRVGDSGIASPSALVFDFQLTRTVPPGGLAQVPTKPADYNRFRGESSPQQYLAINGARVPINLAQLDALKASGHQGKLYFLPDSALATIPERQAKHGDVSCDGQIAPTDALMILQTFAGIPNPGICSTADINCSGEVAATDALATLRKIAGLQITQPEGCPQIGT